MGFDAIAAVSACSDLIQRLGRSRRPRARSTRFVCNGPLSAVDPGRALSFASALRTFYSFIHRPIMRATREHEGREYFIKRLVIDHDVASIFSPTLFEPATRLVQYLAAKLRALQPGNLNFYLALIGALWLVIIALSLL